ncbi:MAG: phage terminase small subunit [Pasteurellaceae bacterium]|nr:phage terminase small subunit [Pasteurellaceae bacterium]
MPRMSPARAHFLRETAENESNQTSASLDGLKGYELMLATLNIHKRSLKQLQSVERKVEFKRRVFPEYQPWIDGALRAGTGVQDAVLMTMLVWAIDIGNYPTALEIAKYALFHDLTMPEQFDRTTACVIAEEISLQAKNARNRKAEFDVDVLLQTHELTAEFDMPDQVRARLLREIAERWHEIEPEKTLEIVSRAIELDANCGAKPIRTKLEKLLNKQTEQPKS